MKKILILNPVPSQTVKKHNLVRRVQKEHPKMKSKDTKIRGG
jgi:hypothetical protein